MPRLTIHRRIDAPIGTVFTTVAEIEHFQQAIPQIQSVVMLSDLRSGVGTRFRETRLMGKREAATELEITEWVENDHVRYVADSHGTVWDTVFRVSAVGGQAELVLVMDAKAYKLLPKLMNPLVMGMIRRAVEKDMDAVKSYCEA